jgi:hypothetical protein
MELRNPPHSLAFSIALKKSSNGDGGLRDICTVDLYRPERRFTSQFCELT